MVDTFVDALKLFARPSSITFLIGVVAIGVVLAFVNRTQRAARWYFASVVVGYWIAASPACAERLVVWQGGAYGPLASRADARGATMVVVLGGGNSTIQVGDLALNQVSLAGGLRVLEAARLHRLLNGPTILVSGGITGGHEGARPEGEAMRNAIVQLGVPAEHVSIEAESKTTREEAIIIARMLSDRPRQPIVLVTSPTHMARSLAVFRAAGLDPIPSASPYKPDHWGERLRWVPSDLGLSLFDAALYDVAATSYYEMRGWMPR